MMKKIVCWVNLYKPTV